MEWPIVPITVLNINIYASIAHRKYTITPLSHWCIAYILSLPASKNKKDQKSFVLFFCVTEETTSSLVPTHQDRHVVTVPVPATTSCAVSFKQPSLLMMIIIIMIIIIIIIIIILSSDFQDHFYLSSKHAFPCSSCLSSVCVFCSQSLSLQEPVQQLCQPEESVGLQRQRRFLLVSHLLQVHQQWDYLNVFTSRWPLQWCFNKPPQH